MFEQSPIELLRRFFSSRTWRALRPLLILTGVAILGVTVGINLLVPPLQRQLQGDGSQVKVTRSDSGELRYLYKKDAEPRSYGQELEADAAQLIPLNWESRQAEKSGQGEDDPPLAVPADDRRALTQATLAFLEQWESFSAQESRASYARRLRGLVDPASLSALAARRDALEGKMVGPGKQAGSRLYAGGLNPAATLEVVRYSDNNALVTTVGSVKMSGPSLVYAGRELRRAYGLVLRRLEGRWVVVRAAAQTLGDTVD